MRKDTLKKGQRTMVDASFSQIIQKKKYYVYMERAKESKRMLKC